MHFLIFYLVHLSFSLLNFIGSHPSFSSFDHYWIANDTENSAASMQRWLTKIRKSNRRHELTETLWLLRDQSSFIFSQESTWQPKVLWNGDMQQILHVGLLVHFVGRHQLKIRPPILRISKLLVARNYLHSSISFHIWFRGRASVLDKLLLQS